MAPIDETPPILAEDRSSGFRIFQLLATMASVLFVGGLSWHFEVGGERMFRVVAPVAGLMGGILTNLLTMLVSRNVATVFGREFASYFNSAVAYVFIIIFLGFAGLYFLVFRDFFAANRAEMRALFEGLPYALLVLVPAISMRIWSEEKKMKTFHLLMTLPIRPTEIIAGKFLAAWSVLGLAILLTLPVPITIELMSDLDWGPVVGGYLGAFVLSGAYLAIGLFVSGMTENQLIAFVLTIVLLAPLVFIGHPFTIRAFEDVSPVVADVCAAVGIVSHFENVARGVVDSVDIVYFLSLILFFLGLNRYTIESHRFG